MVTVSSAFISSRRERIIFSVLSASLCAFKAAALVEVLREVLPDLGKTDLDNTGVARDHFLSLYRGPPNPLARSPYYACGVNGFNIQYLTSNCHPGSVIRWMTDRFSGLSGTPMPACGNSPASLPRSLACGRAPVPGRRARRARGNFAEDGRSRQAGSGSR